jgi:formylglycine-generating enzyme required for sulfatase activity
MRRGPWHILHFIGHGSFDPLSDEGYIVLETERGEPDRLPATQLARLLADHRSLRLVVLNSCEGAQGGNTDIFSSTASLLVRHGLPAVLAMQYEITDRAAIEFARGFYEALADGLPVDAATAEARKAVSLGLTNTVEWGTPVLYMRALDGVLFKLPSLELSAHQIANDHVGSEQAQGDVTEKLAAESNIHDRMEQETYENTKHEQAGHKASKKYVASLTLDLGEGVKMEFMCVPKGDFWMGSDKRLDRQARDDELPQHKVYLDEYLIGKAPVTNQQYRVFVQATNHQIPDHWENGICHLGQEYHPVVNICWEDALAFCQWASLITGQLIRLPSEGEWEKAARGKGQRLYPWGDQLPTSKLCNHGQSFSIEAKTTPVGLYSPKGDSPYGCVDMAGNVWEWVADWYSDNYYKQSPAVNPPGPVNGTERVLRGGSWVNVRYHPLRISFRSWGAPDFKNNDYGFRCAS